MDHLTFYSSFVSFENWQVVCGGAFALVVLAKYFNSNNTKPFPPGPRGWPVIGNVLDIPFEYPWKVYRQWGREASKSQGFSNPRSIFIGTDSDIISLKLPGPPLVVLNSAASADTLLIKRSGIYSDR